MKAPHLLLLTVHAFVAAANALTVYPPVPGLPPSSHYQVRLRTAGDDGEWKHAFTMQSECLTSGGYFDTLAGWTHSYVNFEMSGPVEVELSRADGRSIQSAVVHPKHKASTCKVRDGKVILTLPEPCLVAVDIDGQMDRQDTGKGYKGPPIHTVSLFANPPLAGKPKPGGAGVYAVKPGEAPPTDGTWTTLYFLPGVHDIGLAYPLRAHCTYYLPGDAIVYGTLSNTTWGGAEGVRIIGHGTLSGARLTHPAHARPRVPEKEHHRYRPIEVVGAKRAVVEGVTITDSAFHSLMLIHPYEPEQINRVTWTKIFTWRANGDGINPFGNTLIEDCFIRTQDDSLYVNGPGIRRCVLWNDANGSSFVLSSIPQLEGRRLIVEDCDVIYSRAKWHHWSGGRVFNMRGENDEAGGTGVIFRNIRITDPRPTLQQFFLCMKVPEPYGDGEQGKGDLSGVLFQNITIAAPSVLGEPQLLWGHRSARIRQLTFENLTLQGRAVTAPEFFKTNEYVEGLVFEPRAARPGQK